MAALCYENLVYAFLYSADSLRHQILYSMSHLRQLCTAHERRIHKSEKQPVTGRTAAEAGL